MNKSTASMYGQPILVPALNAWMTLQMLNRLQAQMYVRPSPAACWLRKNPPPAEQREEIGDASR
jgi:hypothetical protein